jgi:hypothetical protein
MIIRYIRDKKNQKAGVLVAMLNGEGRIVIGHSKWHKKLDGDKYNWKLGRKVAIERAEKDSTTPPAFSFKREYFEFIQRVKRYFKDVELTENTLESARLMIVKEDAKKRLDREVKDLLQKTVEMG